MVNSGRLSLPAVLQHSPLHQPGNATPGFASTAPLGAVLPDAPVQCARSGRHSFILRELGPDFNLLCFGPPPAWAAGIASLQTISICDQPSTQTHQASHALHDTQGLLAQRLGAQAGTLYLLRPDQHICARWRSADAQAITAAMARALGHDLCHTPTAAAQACAA
ncbi:FAD-dependent oxidoreductase [compost metagenome]